MVALPHIGDENVDNDRSILKVEVYVEPYICPREFSSKLGYLLTFTFVTGLIYIFL